MDRVQAFAGDTITITVNESIADTMRFAMRPGSLKAEYDENGTQNCGIAQDDVNPLKYTFTMPAADVTVTADFSAWQWLQNAFDNGGTIKLDRDYLNEADDVPLPLIVPDGKSVTLDLNGHVIDERHWQTSSRLYKAGA